ncbi:hypothetical protein [Streptomyces sp. NPDC006510]|uniref:hypothetical protein n=1 Tax=Streptomyces sp. NPDC006510 TaxID=3155600 RepID=UPI0033A1B118
MRYILAPFAVAAGVCAAVLMSGQPAPAGAAAHPVPQVRAQEHAATKGCVQPGETGLYLSKEGTAKVTFSQPLLDGLRKAGATIDAIDPIRLVDNGTAAVMPIGEKYDNIELPSGRVCYPGGFSIVQAATGKVYEIEDFWIQFAAFGDSKFFATPEVDGVPRAAGELTMLNFSVPQAFTTGEFVPHNGGIGPKRVSMDMDGEWARHLNSELGTDFWAGMHLFDTDIAWKGVPTKALPNVGLFPSPGVAGLKVIADAIRPHL